MPWDHKHMFSLCERVYKQLSTYQQISPIAPLSQNNLAIPPSEKQRPCQTCWADFQPSDTFMGLTTLRSKVEIKQSLSGVMGLQNQIPFLKTLVIACALPARLSC